MFDPVYPYAVVAFVRHPIRDEWLFVDHPTRGRECPGGKVEPGESLAQAIVREVLEEAGVVVIPIRYLATRVVPGDTTYKVVGIYCETVQTGFPSEFEANFLPHGFPTECPNRGTFYKACLRSLDELKNKEGSIL